MTRNGESFIYFVIASFGQIPNWTNKILSFFIWTVDQSTYSDLKFTRAWKYDLSRSGGKEIVAMIMQNFYPDRQTMLFHYGRVLPWNRNEKLSETYPKRIRPLSIVQPRPAYRLRILTSPLPLLVLLHREVAP